MHESENEKQSLTRIPRNRMDLGIFMGNVLLKSCY